MSDAMTMEDAMKMSDKQAAEILKPLMQMMHDQHGCPISDAFFALEKAIERLSQPQKEWIPVSERLPEEADGTVLVCMPNESPYNEREQFINAKHNQQVETAHYSQYSDTWYFAMGAVSETRPIAWMPLPPVYREAEKRENERSNV